SSVVYRFLRPLRSLAGENQNIFSVRPPLLRSSVVYRFLRPLRSLVAAAGCVALATASIRGDDPVSSSVRYTGEIVRILDRKCAPCHSTASLAMPLSNYREVREWG